MMVKLVYQNPDIETHLRVQMVNVHKDSTKSKHTSLVMWVFDDFLGVLWICAGIVFSILGFGFMLY